MDNRWIVFGGWSISPDILSGIFGSNALYLDSNTVMPELIGSNGLLKSDWKTILLEKWNILSTTKPLSVSGWSTGAIIATALAKHINPDHLVLLSPTLSFCRKENYRYGVRKSVIESMINSIITDKHKVLEDFRKACGIDCHLKNDYSSKELIAGLQFLEQVDLRCENKLKFNTIALHGKSDKIIPVQAGRFLCEQLRCRFFEINGPHAFFCSQPETEKLKDIINKTFDNNQE